jgi:UDP-glucose 4-epimerase
VLVTGGAGFIGSHLVERIAQDRPRRLVVVDNLFLGSEANLVEARRIDQDVKLYAQDAADYDELGAIIAAERIDVVFNLAIVPLPASLVNPRWTVDHNIALTTVPCELQRQGYFETLVHFSSSEAYGSAAYVPMDESHPSMPSTPRARWAATMWWPHTARRTAPTQPSFGPSTTLGRGRMPVPTPGSSRSSLAAPSAVSRS